MKIAFLFGSLNRGGTETLMLDVFRHSSEYSLELSCIYRKNGVLVDEFKSTGCSMWQLKPGLNILSYLFKLRNLLTKNDIQIVHAVQPLDALLVYFATLGTNIKKCVTFHSFDYHASFNEKIITKLVFAKTDIILFVSQFQQFYYQEKYRIDKEKVKVLNNGISFKKIDFAKVEKNYDLLSKFLNSSETAIKILSVGNFNVGRDQYSICRFAKVLKEYNIEFKLFFAGKRVDNETWRYDQCVDFCKENNLEDNVIFLGSRDDVPQLLSQADLFVYASEHDTFGIAVIEAIAAGVPVMVNDWPVMNEVTLNGELATIYKTKSEDSFYKCFSDFMNNREQYIEKAKIAAKKVRVLYSIEKHINELIERVYKPLLSKS